MSTWLEDQGFQKLEASGTMCEVWFSSASVEFLVLESRNDRPKVKQLNRILGRLCDYGLQGVTSNEQFRQECSLPTGKKDGSKKKVYAVKAHQLRLYGGFICGNKMFLVIEGARKKRDQADQEQLKRIAQALGSYDGER
ncbi:hypothetical protein [Paracoccus sp. SSK6]|uniref:hypothetical protein n=1 Tax=Paracoccus sp. SSK6 TaxID=3143131 RepID=UPI003219620E